MKRVILYAILILLTAFLMSIPMATNNSIIIGLFEFVKSCCVGYTIINLAKWLLQKDE